MKEKSEIKGIPSKNEIEKTTTKTYFLQRENYKSDAKIAIAKHIVDNFLHEGDSIVLDAGASLCYVAQEIAIKSQKEPTSTHFTIMTHNYKAFQILVDQVPRDAYMNIILTGGRYDHDMNALYGPQTIMAYDNFFPRVVLLDISGMLADHGLFCHGNTEELAVKEVIFRKIAMDRIIVADCTKLGVPDALCFGPSQNLCANVYNCIFVIDELNKDTDTAMKERVEREISTLTNVYRAKVDIVHVD